MQRSCTGVRNEGRLQGVSTPEEKGHAVGEGKDLGPQEATMHRALIARGIYLVQGRVDVMFVVKELNRGMSKPTAWDSTRLKRLVNICNGNRGLELDSRIKKSRSS